MGDYFKLILLHSLLELFRHNRRFIPLDGIVMLVIPSACTSLLAYLSLVT